MPEKETLLDISKKKYHALLVEGASVAVSEALEQGCTSENVSSLTEGWVLKTAKKATRFSDTQKK